MPLLDITNLPRKTASVVIATDKENIIPSPTQQPTNLSNDNDLADYLKGICWDDDTLTWQLDITATSVDSQVPVQQWCEDDALSPCYLFHD
jgi:hypothetical protein